MFGLRKPKKEKEMFKNYYVRPVAILVGPAPPPPFAVHQAKLEPLILPLTLKVRTRFYP